MRKMTFCLTLMVILLFVHTQNGFAQQDFMGHLGKPFQAPSDRNGLALYDQFNMVGDGFMVCQEFTDPASAANTSFSADDFVVPAGESWGVRYVDVAGAYFAWNGNPIESLNITFYENNNGVPGAAMHTFTHYTEYNEILINDYSHSSRFEIMLPSTLVFTEGHYWLGVQAVGDFGVMGQWGWLTHQGFTIENEYHWKNPADGYGTGNVDWTAASLMTWYDFNLAFALYGEGLDNDLTMMSIDAPSTSATLGSSEQITVTLKNEGSSLMTGFDVSYSVNGGTTITENVGTFSLEANQIAQYTFTAMADFSVPGPFEITATALVSGDPRPENNTAVKSIYNLGTIYPMPATGTQTITSCGGTFTDSGGLDNNFGDYDDAVTTIYPENSGDRVRLTFLEFNASWGGFYVYNGTDINAPLIGTWYGTDSPGIIDALNPSGALTIHFVGPGWENTSGWVAFISCTTPVPDDFAVLSLNCDIPTIFVGDVPMLSAKIQNYGSASQEKAVTFKANGVEIGIQLTGVLGSADTAWVSVPWTPTEAGNYLIEASVPEDEGADPNNFITIEKPVYPFGSFYEDFEAEMFPPENWRHGGLWGRATDPSNGNFNAQAFFAYNQSDTLVTPRLQVEDGGMISFAAKTTMWWVGNMDLYWLDESTGIWSYIQNIPLNTFSYDLFEIDLSAYVGIGRIGFFVNVTDPYSFSGSVHLDQVIGTGITLYSDGFDLKAKAFEGNDYYNVGEEVSFSLTIRNDGLMNIPGGDYNVKLMRGGTSPQELFSVPGSEIESFTEQTYDFAYTFDAIDQFPVYAEIEYAADEYPVNNTSRTINLHGLAGESEIVSVGEDIIYANWPIEFSVKKSLSETIYTSTEINHTGVIFGIGYEYYFKADEQDAPVRIWMGETDTLNLQTWISATEMTLVYDGLLSIPKGKHSVYIPFQTPFNYSDGSKNLIIMTEKIGDHGQPDQNYMGYGGMYMSTLVMASDVSIPDPYNPPLTGGMSTNMNPNIRFVFNDNLGLASGMVSEQGGTPIEGAKVVVDDLNITAYTDASGNYEMPFIPAGAYQATAEKFTYMPVTNPLQVNTGNNTDLDFTLGLLELVTISGNITGDNDPGSGIAEAVVSLTGYGDFTATSDNGGDFTIGGVYSFQTYQLEIVADGYDVYTAELVVSDSDIDMGTIVLTETMIIPFAVVALPGIEQADIHWSEPASSAQYTLAFDDGIHENGYAGEPNEEVWLGNYFPVEEVTTITSFDIYWASYGLNTQQIMRLDVFDDQSKIVVSSAEFMSGLDEWVNVEIPNLTFHGDYYVMIRWSGLFSQSTFLAFDTTATTPDYAYYRYPDGSFQLLSGLTGQHGTFLIHANAMTEPGDRITGRQVNSYNISTGLLADINNAENWPLLNEVPLTTNEFTDLSWPPMASGKYVYAVKAVYTNGESELSFSNILDYVYVNNTYVAATGMQVYPNPASDKVTITGALNAELTVYSMDGRLSASTIIDSEDYQLDVTRFARGSWLLVVTSPTGVNHFKLLVN
ncbi:MAG: carboxypeptidase regulatory-like domain-containing protein [Bacteroidota bacterium]